MNNNLEQVDEAVNLGYACRVQSLPAPPRPDTCKRRLLIIIDIFKMNVNESFMKIF